MDHPRSSQDSAPAPSTMDTSEHNPQTHGGQEDTTPTQHLHPQTAATNTNLSGGGKEDETGGESYAPTPNTSIRRPARAVSYHEPVRHRDTDRYPAPGIGTSRPRSLPPVPGAHGRDSSEIALEGVGAHGLRSTLDWVVPNTTARRATAHAPVRRSVGGGTLVSVLEKTVGERIGPTLEAARLERARAETKAKLHGWTLNVAIGAQVLLGALTTGVAAATTGRQTSIATSVLGGLSTLAASYLAKARGSGEPEWSARRVHDLDSFLRDCEAFELDHGHKVGSEHDDMINRYRRRFEEIMGNGVEGVGDDVNVKKKRGPDREKVNDSPV